MTFSNALDRAIALGGNLYVSTSGNCRDVRIHRSIPQNARNVYFVDETGFVTIIRRA